MHFLAAQAARFHSLSRQKLRESIMSLMPGSTVQCVNPHCDARGHWVRADLLGSEHCPACGESLRHVPPPLAPRPHFRPRALAAPPTPPPPLRPHPPPTP